MPGTEGSFLRAHTRRSCRRSRCRVGPGDPAQEKSRDTLFPQYPVPEPHHVRREVQLVHLPVAVGAERHDIPDIVLPPLGKRHDVVDLEEGIAVPVPEGGGKVAQLAGAVRPPFCILGHDIVAVEHIGDLLDPAALRYGRPA